MDLLYSDNEKLIHAICIVYVQGPAVKQENLVTA